MKEREGRLSDRQKQFLAIAAGVGLVTAFAVYIKHDAVQDLSDKAFWNRGSEKKDKRLMDASSVVFAASLPSLTMEGLLKTKKLVQFRNLLAEKVHSFTESLHTSTQQLNASEFDSRRH